MPYLVATVLALAGLCAPAPAAQSNAGPLPSVAGRAFEVRAASPRAGFLFTDSEPLDVRVRVAGAGAEAVVEYTVEESGGPWRGSGKATLSKLLDGAGEARLPLKLPGRGLYHLSLAGTSGEAKATAEAWVAVVFTPGRPDAASPWGIFYTPHVWFDGKNPEGPRIAAEQHRLLGASWSRLNFWAGSFGKITVTAGERPDASGDYTLWKQYARELRREGISILGEIAQCPRELSSRPEETEQVGDAGPVYNRVKPRDYAQWDRLMEKVAADFRDEIQVWEIWNEANLENRYWTGTPEDFLELVKHTSQALRRGNPKARIAAAGFVHGHAFADKLFGMGMGQYLDILTVHYTDENPGDIVRWQELLKKHHLSLPIWNSEERSEVPLNNLSGPIERSFKFIHVLIGYPDYRPLVRKDWSVLPAGILYSVGAHCLGTAKFVERSDKVPECEAALFRRGAEIVGVFRPRGFATLSGSGATVQLAVEPLSAREGPMVTDAWGRSRQLPVRGGRAELPLAGTLLFVNGCRRLEVLGATPAPARAVYLFEAESGRYSPGWGASTKPGFSGDRILEIWNSADPGAEGYWAEVKLTVPEDGTYEVILSGNGLSRLARPRSISPFAWSIDGGEEHPADGALPVLAQVSGLPEPPSVLGTVKLSAGEHTFRLRLTSRRDAPDTNYALWFDAIALRRR